MPPTILTWPDDRLRQLSQPITVIDDSVHELYANLVRMLVTQHRGLGIAAPQIGDFRRMFLIDQSLFSLTTRLGVGVVCFINPEIVWTSDQTQDDDEGCLSFPGVFVKVVRPQRVKVRALQLTGEAFETNGEGLLARCLLHEHDHLEGRLLADHPHRR